MNLSPTLSVAVSDYMPDSIGVYINPRDIVVSPDPIESAHWNCLEGHIISATAENGTIRLTVDVGVELVAIVARDDFQEIRSGIFSQSVFAAFKASNVRVF